MTRRMRIDDLTDLAVPSQPALSPDGDRVVYVLRTLDAGKDRNVDQLWTVPTAGGTPRRLTAGPSDTSPAWSPDGSRIAFVRDRQMHVLDTDGGEPERVTDLPLGAGAPVWSPDSARLAFSAPVDPGTGGPLVADRLDYQADGAGMFGSVRSQVHVVELASGDCRQLTDGTEHALAPAWSPDGSTIAFTRGVGDDTDLRFRLAVHLLAVDDPKALPRVVAFADGVARTVSYVADGESLLVVGWDGDPVGHARLFRVPLDGGVPVDLTAALDRNVMPGAPAYPGGLAAGDGRRADPLLPARARLHPPLVDGRRRLGRPGRPGRRRTRRVGTLRRRRPCRGGPRARPRRTARSRWSTGPPRPPS